MARCREGRGAPGQGCALRPCGAWSCAQQGWNRQAGSSPWHAPGCQQPGTALGAPGNAWLGAGAQQRGSPQHTQLIQCIVPITGILPCGSVRGCENGAGQGSAPPLLHTGL